MKHKRILIVVMIALCVGLTGTVAAEPKTPDAPDAALSTAFTYQGRLTDGGAPANGTYDFDFLLYDLPSAGTVIGHLPKGDVAVTNGLFVVSLDFGASAFNGQARYLQIWVRPGSSTGGYTALSPRQELTATPYALFSQAPWATSGNDISYTQGKVGIGLSTPLTQLHVKGNTASSGNNTAVFENTTIGPYSSAIHYGTTGDWYIRSAAANGKVVIQDMGGKVGIGTTGPLALLHLKGSTASSGNNTAVIENPSIGPYVSSIHYGTSGDWYIRSAAAPGKVVIQDNGGNVGIGTTTPCPTVKLHVISSGTASCGAGAVLAESDTDNGVIGSSQSNTGVVGLSQYNSGVEGSSNSSAGVYGHSNSWTGVIASSTTGGFILEGYDGGNNNRRFAVGRATGNVYADGAYTGPADLAEMMTVSGLKKAYSPGDVLVIGHDGKLMLSDKSNATNLAGVYSAEPGFVGDTEIAAHGIEYYDSPQTQERIAVALIGIVPVKVTDENGPIHPGDLLTTSSTLGHAMKAKPVVINGVEIYPTGTILGKALASWEKGRGVIQVLVTLR